MELSDLQDFTIQVKEHWGPTDLEQQQYKNLPISFFNRFEKLGRCCDPILLLHKKNQDDNQFRVVQDNTKKIPKTTITAKPKTYMQLKSQQANRYPSSMPNKNYFNYRRNKQAHKTKFKESVTIKNNWEQVKDVYKTTFEELAMKRPEITEIKEVGVIRELNKEVEKVQRREYRLNFEETEVAVNQTITDPVFREILAECDQKEEVRKVFANEKFLTALMTLKVSQYPWHIKLTKLNNILILDSFDPNMPTYLDMFTANENTQNNMPNDQIRINQTCVKATRVTNSFKKQIADGKILYEAKGEEEEEEPEQESNQPYTRYIKIQLDKDLEIYTKANIDAGKLITDETGQVYLQSYLVRTLFQTQTNYQWKKKFQTSAGKVISQQYLANNCSWQKWLIQSEFANVYNFKVGCISQTRQPGKFNILNVTDITASQIEKNISFKVKDCWPLLRTILEGVFGHDNGEYVMVKSPYHHTVKLYRIPEKDEEDQGRLVD